MSGSLSDVREEVASLLATQPYPSALLRKLRPPPVVHESGVKPTEGSGVSSPSAIDELSARRRAR